MGGVVSRLGLGVFALFFLVACPGGSDDFDGDGTPDALDCDPADPRLNGLDLDGDLQSSCEGDCDDTDPAMHGIDTDRDGLSPCAGDCDDTIIACTDDCSDPDGDGFAACAGDCAPDDGTRYPGAEEGCDFVDTNCDGSVPAIETDDADGDGWPVCADCQDGDSEAHPDATEFCNGRDDDCDGAVDEDTQNTDADGDGWAACVDCDDTDPAQNPGVVWEENLADGLDLNCDGLNGLWLGGSWGSLEWDDNIRLASKIEAVGDVDGDAIPDLVATATDWPGDGSDHGAVLFVPGALLRAGIEAGPTDVSRILEGEPGEGCQTAPPLGDLNGDGITELAVGCRAAQLGSGDAEGRFYIVDGAALQGTGTDSLASAAIAVIDGDPGSRIGEGVEVLEDLDGDGLGELVFWAPAGGAWIFTGAQLSGGGTFGLSDAAAVLPDFGGMVPIDDVIGDPVVDVAADMGDAWALIDGSRLLSEQVDSTNVDLTGVPPSGWSNPVHSTASAGDVDGDGLDDVLVLHRGHGAVLYTGQALADAVGTVGEADALTVLQYGGGSVLAPGGLGDLDGDGLGEIALANSSAFSDRGAVSVLRGADLLASPLIEVGAAAAAFVGENPDDDTAKVVSPGDLTGDGVPDLVLGAHQWPGLAVGHGKLFLWEGSW